MTTVMLLGATGQVGQALQACPHPDYPLATPGRAAVDFERPGQLARAVAAQRPALVINCVAYNQVDGAEQSPALATRINHTGVVELAEACARLAIPLVHFSTDYVFAGKDPSAAPRLYTENDVTGPVNHYGHTKLLGEQAALCSARNLVLRVSWVFSEHGQNMGQRLLTQAMAGQPLRMAQDQYGSPTYAGHIAATLWALIPELLAGAPGGLYHLSGTEAVSRYDLARALLDAAVAEGLICAMPSLVGVSQQAFIAHSSVPVAPRPQWSALGTGALAARLGRPVPSWREGLQATVTGLRKRWATERSGTDHPC